GNRGVTAAVQVHGAELVEGKLFSVAAHALLPEEHGAGRAEADQGRRDHHQREKASPFARSRSCWRRCSAFSAITSARRSRPGKTLPKRNGTAAPPSRSAIVTWWCRNSRSAV